MAKNKGPSLSPLEKFLRLFTVIRRGEGKTALLLTANIFVVLAAYYVIKPVREALILGEEGAVVKSYASAGQAVLLMLAIPLYSKLASHFSRRRLINYVTLFFTGCLVLIYFLAKAQVPLGVAFYLWVGIFNLMVVAQFWAFANDIYTEEEGSRLFVILSAGATAGAVGGSLLSKYLISPLGIHQMLLLAALLLVASFAITNLIDSSERKRFREAKDERAKEVDEPIGKQGAFSLLLRSRYLLLIAFLVLFLNFANSTGEFILGKVVMSVAHSTVSAGEKTEEFVGTFYSQYFLLTTLATFFIQLALVSRILRYLGVRVALLLFPIVVLGGYALVAIVPILAVARWAKIAENATDYSLQNTTRNVLFLVTSREEKYKAKQVTDSIFQRLGDVFSAVLVFVGTQMAFTMRHFAFANVVLAVLCIGISILIGRHHRKLSKLQKASLRAAA